METRIYKYDNLKCFLILCVVAGHLIDFFPAAQAIQPLRELYVFIYSFHMPAFLFLSGLFYKETRMAQKAAQFLAIALLMKIVTALSNLLFYGHLYFELFRETGAPWYMLALAAYQPLMRAIRGLPKLPVLLLALAAALFLGYGTEMPEVFALARVITFFPVYLLGSMLDRAKLCTLTERRPLRLLGVAIPVLWGVLIAVFYDRIKYLGSVFSGKNSYALLGAQLAPYGALLRLAVYAIAAAVCFSLLCLMPNRRLPVLTVCGTRTLQIYFWHSLLIRLLLRTGAAAALLVLPGGPGLYLALAPCITLLLALPPFSFPTQQVSRALQKAQNKNRRESKIS